MSLQQDLPPELIDNILDHCHADHQALYACSLVCREWVSTTRYHLFSCPDISVDKALPCVEILRSPHCTFPSSVHGVRISAGHGGASKPWLIQPVVKAIHDAGLVIYTLKLDFGSMLSHADAIIDNLPRTFPHVTHLAIHHSYQRNNVSFIHFLCGLKKLERLELLNFSENGIDNRPSLLDLLSKITEGGPSPDLQLSDCLKTLYVSGGGCGGTCEVLLKYLQPHPKLSTCTIRLHTRPHPEEFAHITAYLEANRTTLQHLTLVGAIDEFDLQALSELRSLYLSVKWRYNNPVSFLCNVLRTVTSTFLREISIHSWASPADATEWSELNVLLSSPPFISTNSEPLWLSITFLKERVEKDGTPLSAVEEQFPGLADRGVLRVGVADDHEAEW